MIDRECQSKKEKQETSKKQENYKFSLPRQARKWKLANDILKSRNDDVGIIK